jgi:predicted dehydrogenase
MSRSPESSAPVRVAVTGLGFMARQHLGALRTLPGVEVVGLCSRSAEKREAFEAEFGAPARWSDTERMLDDVAPDAVFVTVSVQQIADVAGAVLARGTAALIEKPPGLTVAETERLRDLAESTGAVAMVGLNRRFYGNMLRAAELAREAGGLTGIVVEAPERSTDYMRAHFTPEVRERWVVANGLHCIDLITFFAGAPETVQTQANAWSWPAGDAFAALLRFPGGVIGQYTSFWTSPGRWGVRLYAPDLRITIEPLEQAVAWYRGRDPEPIELPEIDRVHKPGIHAQAAFFVDAVRRRAPVEWPGCSLRDALTSMRLAEALLDARPVRVG